MEIFKIQLLNTNLHVLGLSKTCSNNKFPNELYKLSQDYYLFRNDRKLSENGSLDPKEGGGVA